METPETVEQKMIPIIAEVLQIPAAKVLPAARFKDDLGADSLDLILLLYELEDRMGAVLPDDEAKRLVTVADAVRVVTGLLSKA